MRISTIHRGHREAGQGRLLQRGGQEGLAIEPIPLATGKENNCVNFFPHTTRGESTSSRGEKVAIYGKKPARLRRSRVAIGSACKLRMLEYRERVPAVKKSLACITTQF